MVRCTSPTTDTASSTWHRMAGSSPAWVNGASARASSIGRRVWRPHRTARSTFRIAATKGFRSSRRMSPRPGGSSCTPTAGWPSGRWRCGRLARSTLCGARVAPDPALPADGFSMRIERTWRLAAGIHRFGIDAAGGVRLWVDSRLLVDAWEGPAVARMVELDLAAGEHRVRLEFNDPGGAASLRAGWTTIPETPTSTATPTPPIPTATPRPGTRAFLPRLARNSLR